MYPSRYGFPVRSELCSITEIAKTPFVRVNALWIASTLSAGSSMTLTTNPRFTTSAFVIEFSEA
jgi:hypothetical protein